MRTAAAWSFPCGGCFLWAGDGPYELRFPIFLRPLGGALKNRSAAPASPPCFRRRRRSAPLLFESTLESETSVFYKTKSPAYFRTLSIFGGRGWITQAAHLKRPRRGLFAAGTYGGGPYELRLPIFLQPLGGALKNRSAAPASPPCFRRRRRSAPLLFESTLESETSVFYKTKSPAYFRTLSIFGGRGWIRTTEAEKQQIYSLSPLATREHAHILFVSVAGRLA